MLLFSHNFIIASIVMCDVEMPACNLLVIYFDMFSKVQRFIVVPHTLPRIHFTNDGIEWSA